jgi:hypothetical protein
VLDSGLYTVLDSGLCRQVEATAASASKAARAAEAKADAAAAKADAAAARTETLTARAESAMAKAEAAVSALAPKVDAAAASASAAAAATAAAASSAAARSRDTASPLFRDGPASSPARFPLVFSASSPAAGGAGLYRDGLGESAAGSAASAVAAVQSDVRRLHDALHAQGLAAPRAAYRAPAFSESAGPSPAGGPFDADPWAGVFSAPAEDPAWARRGGRHAGRQRRSSPRARAAGGGGDARRRRYVASDSEELEQARHEQPSHRLVRSAEKVRCRPLRCGIEGSRLTCF